MAVGIRPLTDRMKENRGRGGGCTDGGQEFVFDVSSIQRLKAWREMWRNK